MVEAPTPIGGCSQRDTAKWIRLIPIRIPHYRGASRLVLGVDRAQNGVLIEFGVRDRVFPSLHSTAISVGCRPFHRIVDGADIPPV